MTEPAAQTRAWRWAALGLFVLTPALLAMAGGIAWIRLTETEGLIAQQSDLLAQIDARLARIGADGGGMGDTSAIYMDAGGPSLAAAALQEHLAGLVEAAGGRIVEQQVVDETEPDDVDDVAVRLTVDVTNTALMTLLHQVETGIPLLFVEAASIRQLPASGEDAPVDPLLRADLRVRGYWKVAP